MLLRLFFLLFAFSSLVSVANAEVCSGPHKANEPFVNFCQVQMIANNCEKYFADVADSASQKRNCKDEFASKSINEHIDELMARGVSCGVGVIGPAKEFVDEWREIYQKFSALVELCESKGLRDKCNAEIEKQVSGKVTSTQNKRVEMHTGLHFVKTSVSQFFKTGFQSGVDIVNTISQFKSNADQCEKTNGRLSCNRNLAKKFFPEKEFSDSYLLQMPTYLFGPNMYMTAKGVAAKEKYKGLSQKEERDLRKYENQKVIEDYFAKEGISYQCFNAKKRAELLCYGLAPAVYAALGMTPSAIAQSGRSILSEELRSTLTKKHGIDFKAGATGATAKEVDQFVTDYKDRVFTSSAQNQEWIEWANQPRSGNRIFFTSENSVLKKLNSVADKDKATALTNRYKEILIEERQKALVPIQHNSRQYGDYKALSEGFEGSTQKIAESLPEAVSAADARFYNEPLVKDLIAKNPALQKKWFPAGIGATADQANIAGRVAREKQFQTQSVVTFEQALPALKTKKDIVADLNQELANEFKNTSVFVESKDFYNRKLMLPDEDVFDLVRKYENPKDLAQVLKERYALENVTISQAGRLKKMVEQTDTFSPQLQIACRTCMNLNDATEGYVGVDFAGLGGKNLAQTHRAVLSGKTVEDVLLKSRLGEAHVTKSFADKKAEYDRLVKESFGGEVTSYFSGDDGLSIPQKPVTEMQKIKLVKNAANSRVLDPSAVRISFVPAGVKDPLTRSLLSVHGEEVEKSLRRGLSGQVEPNQLKATLFAVDMQTKDKAKGPIRLMVGRSQSGSRLSKSEKQKMQQAFEAAVQKVNKDTSASYVALPIQFD